MNRLVHATDHDITVYVPNCARGPASGDVDGHVECARWILDIDSEAMNRACTPRLRCSMHLIDRPSITGSPMGEVAARSRADQHAGSCFAGARSIM